jgi:hypothetical protein
MTDSIQHPAHGIYQHGDGGIYLIIGAGRSSASGEPMVIYRHLWPFEQELWVRPLAEWQSRFARISYAEFQSATREDQDAAKAAITAKRTARKGVAKG